MKNKHGTVEDLSRQIARWEAETKGDDASKDGQHRVAVALVHNHLPRLADHDIIEYDQRSGDIVLVATDTELDSLTDPTD